DANDNAVGSNSIAVESNDIAGLTFSQTTYGSGTAAATARIIFDGDDIGMTSGSQSLDALAFVPLNGAAVANTDIYTVPAQGVFDSRDTWFDDAWGARQRLSINNVAGTEDLTEFPILVTLDATRIDYSRTHSNGADLRFVDPDGTLLDYEIESWNPNGKSYIWVKVPQIDANSGSDYLWMYYDNSAAVDAQNSAGVWSNGYAGVWHLNDDLSSGSTIADSTANAKDGVATNLSGTDQVNGITGGALDFDGVSESIRIASSATDALAISGTQLTLEGWIQRNGDSVDTMAWLGRQLGVSTDDAYLMGQAANVSGRPFVNVSAGVTTGSSTDVPQDQWFHMTGVFDNGTLSLYQDGVLLNQITGLPTSLTTDNNDVTIGAQENGADNTLSNFWNGLLDEIRISSVARSAAWTDAQYTSMTDGFLRFGSVHSKAGVLENDYDLNGDPLTVVAVDDSSLVGTLTMNPDGTFLYDPGSAFDSLPAGQIAVETFTYDVEDGKGSISTATVYLKITGTNHAPVLSVTSALTLNDIQENDTNPAGQSIADLLSDAGGTISDLDGTTNFGIAVFDADDSHGDWQYSLNGTDWLSFGVLSDSSATLLDLTSLVRFVPATNYFGDAHEIRFVAWDQSTGTVGDTGVDATNRGGESAFSTAEGEITATVIEVTSPATAVADAYSVTEDTPFATDMTGWDAVGWTHRMQLTFDNATRAENLADFVVLVKLDVTRISYDVTQDQGQDLRFYDADGTLLDHEIERWNESGTSYVWVRIPQIDAASASDSIWMYYGNSTATDGQNSAGVWQQCDAVYHFADSVGDGGTVTDSTGRLDGTSSGSVSGAGAIGGGQSFDGVNDTVNIGRNIDLLSGVSATTISTWVNPDDVTQLAGLVSVSRYALLNGQTNDSRAALEMVGSNLLATGRASFLEGQETSITTTSPLQSGQWQLTTTVIDYADDRIDIYLNGVLIYSEAVAFSQANTDNADAENAAIGSNDMGNGSFFAGTLDEVRIAGVERSSAWIDAEYASMTDSLLSYGAAELSPGVLRNDLNPDGGPVQAVLIDGPSHAQLFTLNADGTFAYTPQANYFGPDSFRYLIDDGLGGSSMAVVSLNVASVGDPPVVVTNSIPIVEGENLLLTNSMLRATDADPADGPGNLTYSVISATNLVIKRLGVTVTSFTQADIDSGNIRFVHSGAETAPVLTFSVTDGTQTTGTITANFLFSNQNDAPTISVISDQSINEDQSTGPISFTIGDVDTPVGSLVVSVSSNNGALVP
ncbi:MAG: DUF2341 domain-containing protein, partial [Planctomycetaceae bacterium]|nr:DUF2341 domain-containing protein [Planctomycetaceae bacterium]